ncbi:methionine adenosyltransferase [Schlesneria paludicola]|uniref:methionine adenosyltransferase n=1 Tax=Schlesneria paludicola TaxID=360056 RepID=UPI0036F1CE0A
MPQAWKTSGWGHSNETAVGKNLVSHVGKVYFLLTHRIANEVVQRFEGVAEVYISLCRQNGQHQSADNLRLAVDSTEVHWDGRCGASGECDHRTGVGRNPRVQPSLGQGEFSVW